MRVDPSRCLWPSGGRPPASRRGAALLLVVAAVLIVGVIATSFLASQSTTITIAENVTDHAEARGIAESGVSYAVAHLLEQSDWRATLTPGQWVEGIAVAGGTVDLRFDDDTDDFTDDPSAPVTVTARGYAGNTTFRATARVTPSVDTSQTLLFIVGDTDLGPYDAKKRTLFESWGYAVTVMGQNASGSDMRDAAADVDVVYISESISSSRVNNKLLDTPTGVVCGEGYLIDDFDMSSNNSNTTYTDTLDVIDASHPITAEFGTGDLLVAASDLGMRVFNNLASGPTPLATEGGGQAMLVVADLGASLTWGTAAGRRVMMPFGENDWDPDELNANGQQLLRNALTWAGGGASAADDAILHYAFAEQAGAVVNDIAGQLNINLTLSPGNGDLTWVDDANGGTGLFFDQSDSNGTAVARTASTSAADPLRDAIQANRAFTVQVLMRPEGFDSQGGRIVSHSATTNYHDRNFSLMGDGGGSMLDVETRVRQDTWCAPAGGPNGVLPRDDLQVLTWTIDVNRTYHNSHVYVDGALVQQASVWGNFNNWASFHLLLGNEATLDRPFRGTLYDVKVFDRALTAGEVAANASALLAGEIDETQDRTPALIAAYDFVEPDPVTPGLVGHWPLDRLTASSQSNGLQIAANDEIRLSNNSLIDSYSSLWGPYDPATAGSNAQIATNATSSNAVFISNGTTFAGDVRVGVGGNPDQVVQDVGTLTGSKTILDQNIDITDPADPSDEFPASTGDREDEDDADIGTTGVVTRLTYDDWDIEDATITIHGDVWIDVRDDFRIEDSEIVLADDATLRLYCGGIAYIHDSRINDDSSRTADLTLINYGDGHDNDFRVYSGSVIAGAFRSADDFEIERGATIYGTVFAEDDLKRIGGNGGSGARIHCDVSLGLAGDSFVDETGIATGTIRGGVGVVPGRVGNAAAFDGHDDFVVVPHDDVYLLSEGTLSFWFYADDLDGLQGMVTKDSQDFDTGGHFRVYLNGSRLEARLQSTEHSHVVESSGGAVSARQWHHVAVGFGTGGLRMYLDGQKVGQHAYTGGLGSTSGGAGNHEPWVFGVDTHYSDDLSADNWSEPFHGRLDDVRLHNRNLNETQAENVFLGHDPGAAIPGIVADVSGYGDPLDLEIGDPDAVTWIAGGGLTFDGTTGAVSPNAATKVRSALVQTGEFTVVIDLDRSDDDPAVGTEVLALEHDPDADALELDDVGSGAVTASWATSQGDESRTESGGLGLDRQYLILTYNGQEVSLYRDSAQLFGVAETGSLDAIDAAARLGVGYDLADPGSSNDGFVGTIHALRIYDRGVDPIQVGRIVSGQEPGEPAEPEEDGDASYDFVWVGGP